MGGSRMYTDARLRIYVCASALVSTASSLLLFLLLLVHVPPDFFSPSSMTASHRDRVTRSSTLPCIMFSIIPFLLSSSVPPLLPSSLLLPPSCFFLSLFVRFHKQIFWAGVALRHANPDDRCYTKGYGCPVDYGQAVAFYETAAKRGISVAISNLGVCYDRGQGVPADPVGLPTE